MEVNIKKGDKVRWSDNVGFVKSMNLIEGNLICEVTMNTTIGHRPKSFLIGYTQLKLDTPIMHYSSVALIEELNRRGIYGI